MIRRRPAVVARVAAVGLVVAGAGWWGTHPDRLPAVGIEQGSPGTVGAPTLFGLGGWPEDGAVVLRSVRPRVEPGSSAADVRVLFCVGGQVLGIARVTAEQHCERLPAVDGARLAVPTAPAFGQLVLEVVPRGPGVVRVDGVEVSYRDGIRFGTQSTGSVAVLTTES